MYLFYFAFARVTSLHVSMVCALTYTDISFIAGKTQGGTTVSEVSRDIYAP